MGSSLFTPVSYMPHFIYVNVHSSFFFKAGENMLKQFSPKSVPPTLSPNEKYVLGKKLKILFASTHCSLNLKKEEFCSHGELGGFLCGKKRQLFDQCPAFSQRFAFLSLVKCG